MGSPVKIEPADFWELLARRRYVDAIEHDLLKQRIEGQRRLAEAKAAAMACHARVRERYALPDADWQLDDATCEVTPVP